MELCHLLMLHSPYSLDREAYSTENKQNFAEIHIRMSKITVLLTELNGQCPVVELESPHISQAPQDCAMKERK